MACLRIHFTGNTEGIAPCPDVRVVFADLHLIGADSNHVTHFSTIGGLLENTIRPAGPYLIVLWTKYPDQAPALQAFLEERLQGVTKPFNVLPLAKSDHLDVTGNVKDPDALMNAILEITETLPEMGVLLDWESRVHGAIGNTVSSILELSLVQEAGKRSAEIGRILTRLGIEAVGRPNLAEDPFRAINEALLPILADRIANLGSSGTQDDVWRDAVRASGQQTLTAMQAAKLNSMVHLAQLDNANECERGAIVVLPVAIREEFSQVFGLDEEEAAQNQFGCNSFDSEDENLRWALVQAQAACDYAQRQPGSLPCYLALDSPAEFRTSNTPPAALWRSPPFELDGEIRHLHVNARFPVSLSRKEFKGGKPLYRLREQMLAGLAHHIHSYGGRPGMISFR